MNTAFPLPSWDEALRSFVLHLNATRALNTTLYYKKQLTLLVRWAETNVIPLERFGKRHLDTYLAYRLDNGMSPTTLRS